MLKLTAKKWVDTVVNTSPWQAMLVTFVASGSIASYSLFQSYQSINQQSPKTERTRTKLEDLNIEAKSLAESDEQIILKRNLFNSDGELGDAIEGEELGELTPVGDLVASDLPLELKGVIFAGDPNLGLAMVENKKTKRMSSFVVGDELGEGAILKEIYETRIILERNQRREYIELAEFSLPEGRRKQTSPGSARSSKRLATGAPPDSYREEGFERDGGEIRLTEEFKRSLLAPDTMSQILQDAKAEPNMVNGELKGFRLTRIREGSIYEKAGFQNDDVVEEINGIPLRDAAGAIRLLQQLREAKDIEVRLNRGGTSRDMSITIQ